MPKNGCIFPRLSWLMMMRNMPKTEIAEKIDVCYTCFFHKLNGKTEFTLSEAIKLKKALQYDGPLEKLFETNVERVKV